MARESTRACRCREGGRGSRVAIQLPNLPQAVYSYYGALRAGAQVVLTNPLVLEREIDHQWNDGQVEVAIVGDGLFASKLTGLRGRLPVREYLVAGIADHLRVPLGSVVPTQLRKRGLSAKLAEGSGVYRLRRLMRTAPPVAQPADLGPHRRHRHHGRRGLFQGTGAIGPVPARDAGSRILHDSPAKPAAGMTG